MTMPKPARLAIGGLVALAAAGAALAYTHAEGASAAQTTDDAYVQADFSTVAPRVAGTVARVLVQDNQAVKAGQLLAVLDDRDYRVALAAALADLAASKAHAEGLQAALARQSSVIDQASATLAADRAAMALSSANAARYQALAQDGSASRQEQQETASRLAADQASHRRDMAAQSAARAQVPMIAADLADARAAVAKAQAAVDAARLALSYTQIRAPVDGIVGQRIVRVGNYVPVGTPLLAVVPVADAYVEARFRETQLTHIHPGQRATIAIDTLPGVTLRGHVESIAPATGVSFAQIAPENATGNFTKITQRLAVRIVLEPRQQAAARLRVGMSAVPTIITD